MTSDKKASSIVLLVDDQKSMTLMIEKSLEDWPNIEVHICNDSTRAIEMAEHLGPTVILQDITMPDLDGFELLQKYRNNSVTSNIPIIMLSSNDKPETKAKAKAFARGANDYVVKLPDKIELAARIQYHSKAYIDHLELEAAYKDLAKSRTQLARAYRELEQLSLIDALTGITNRRQFEHRYDYEWKRALRETEPLSLILIDIDYFKQYNDTYGHPQGDECLKQVAQTLKESLQRPTDLVARYGGEEFIVLLPSTPSKGAIHIAEQLRKSILNLNIPHSKSHVHSSISISLGIATTAPMLKHKSDMLIKTTDDALYEAKDQGRNRVICKSL
ncbi:MAG: diguanylate cyclase [Mariprofundaceae bacterium]